EDWLRREWWNCRRRAKATSSSTMFGKTIVAIEGGLYSNHTLFKEYLNMVMIEIIGEEIAPYVIPK
ncbi:hypothetical protein Ancab_028698, partial [Ancistrocladus abbreviatus]